MTFAAYRLISLMAVMTLRAVNIVGLRQMILMRIRIEIFRLFGNRFQRLMAFEAGAIGRRRFGRRFRVTRIARHAFAFVAIGGK